MGVKKSIGYSASNWADRLSLEVVQRLKIGCR